MSDSKKCPHCGEVKLLSEFHKNRARKDGLAIYCKQCVKEVYPAYKKNWRKRNPDYFKKYQTEHAKQYRETNERYRKSRLDMITALKTDCVKCGETRRYVIQFHHINPDDKEHTLASSAIGKETALREIEKCVCLCANCHMEFHHLYGNNPVNPTEALSEYLKEDN